MPSPPDATLPIADLRRRVAAAVTLPAATLPFGMAAIDDRVAHGGLATNALHEVAPRSPCLSDDAAATLFVAGAAARLAGTRPGRQVLWALTRFDLYAPGLEQAGFTSDRVFFAQARDDA